MEIWTDALNTQLQATVTTIITTAAALFAFDLGSAADETGSSSAAVLIAGRITRGTNHYGVGNLGSPAVRLYRLLSRLRRRRSRRGGGNGAVWPVHRFGDYTPKQPDTPRCGGCRRRNVHLL